MFFFTSWQMFAEQCSSVEFRICQLTHTLVSDSSWQHIHHCAGDKIKHTICNRYYLIEVSVNTILFFNLKYHNVTMYRPTPDTHLWLYIYIFTGYIQAEMAASFNEVFEKPWWNFSGCNSRNNKFFILVRATSSVLQGELCRLSFKPHQTEVIHICIVNKHKASDAKIHVHTNTALCFSSVTQKNNEPAHWAGELHRPHSVEGSCF